MQFGMWTRGWPKEVCIRWRSRSPMGRSTFEEDIFFRSPPSAVPSDPVFPRMLSTSVPIGEVIECHIKFFPMKHYPPAMRPVVKILWPLWSSNKWTRRCWWWRWLWSVTIQSTVVLSVFIFGCLEFIAYQYSWRRVSSYFQTSSQNALLSVSLFHPITTRPPTRPDSFKDIGAI